MKFLCHNCGFSAEIPKAIGACPMCGSTNTDSEVGTKETEEVALPETAEKNEQTPVPSSTPTPSEDLRAKNASLSEEFFTKKPYQEEQEIADLLKEIGAEEQKQEKKPFPVKTVVGTIGALGVVLGTVLVVVFTTTVNPPVRPSAFSEPKPETSSAAEVKPEPAPAPEAKPEPAPAPEAKPEPAPAPEAKPEPAPAPEAKPEPAPAPEAKPEPAPAPAPVPKQKPTPSAKPALQPKSNPTVKPAGASFEKLVAEGNQAIAEQRFNDAIHSYKDALKLNPRAGKVHKYLGIAYASMGNAAKACEHYKKYLAMVPDAPDRAQVEQLTADCP